MSGGFDVMNMKEDDVCKMLTACTHLGTENVNPQMERYVYKRRPDGVHIINLRRTWEKLLLAARAIAAIETPSEVFVISSRNQGQRAILKYAAHTGATPIAGRFTPGAFTNQIQAAFREPRLLIITDTNADHQPITEASYVSIPVIAFANTDSPLRFVDIAIPCNNKSTHSIGLMWWFLAREVLRIRGTITREARWDVVVDLFFYRDPEEADKEEQIKDLAPLKAEVHQQTEVWGNDPVATESWAEEVPVVLPVATGPTSATDVTPAAAAAEEPPFNNPDDWANQVQDEWSAVTPAAAPAKASDWGGSTWN